ncbi:MAG: hypothetical protein H6574_17415 [Lewinellaceae bacterium]|nr:hypothetical protein [Lewinellaceae bacterium]
MPKAIRAESQISFSTNTDNFGIPTASTPSCTLFPGSGISGSSCEYNFRKGLAASSTLPVLLMVKTMS